ncbi:class I SAM-dependent methyltransferase [Vallitalea okinawensis]|uniref:class I SAM-dependent methyltransferase n=1 Tax=Vallitalea okinawensis TaxID=2078660 RepID=UPI000CFD3752|nr:class I SAM-dependent methyltransferase [Vallitalea okinawensis]
MQNIYDNDQFYEGYIELRNRSNSYNELLEIPAIRSLLPDLMNKVILDLGCGYGEGCLWYVSNGAKTVVGVDISEKMIERAKDENSSKFVEFINKPIETFTYEEDFFDLVLSSVAFHYIEDFDALIRKIYSLLKPGGQLVFSQEHPVILANKKREGWIRDQNNKKVYWPLDDYQLEGKREETWIVDGVIKYHRTFSTIINTLIRNGFIVDKILEPIATDKAIEQNYRLVNEKRRPSFLMIKARKQNE